MKDNLKPSLFATSPRPEHVSSSVWKRAALLCLLLASVQISIDVLCLKEREKKERKKKTYCEFLTGIM